MKTLKIAKIGGNVIDDDIRLASFLSEFAKLSGPKLLVHGGGKLATRLAEQMGIEVKMIEGRRITDSETLDIITMVYAGKINKNIVAQLQKNNCSAIGLTGADGNTIISHKRPVKTFDFGYVGDVDKVNSEVISVLIENKITPVFCAITHDKNGQLLNTNADTIASELAIGLSHQYQVDLFYCFEKSGVLGDINDEESVVELINTANYKEFKDKGIIADGMIPKLDNCFHAIENNVSKVCIGKPEMLFNKISKFTTIRE
jgi:acetylglutamate kinase